MTFLRLIRAAAYVGALAAGLSSVPAMAQATRTWVSGVGDDANPCSRTAPCKTFAGAISKTAAGGEINCLDSGGFGAVTITKSITILCEGVVGGVLVAGTNGIVINAAATDVVHLRGLDIQGASGALNGIRFVAGGALHVENVTIRGFNATNGQAISFQPGASSELYLTNVTMINNGTASTGGGILIQPTSLGSASVALRDVRVQNNLNIGININTTANSGPASEVFIENSQFDGSNQGVVVQSPPGTSNALVMLVNSTVSVNGGFGILGNGSGAIVRVGNTAIFGNNNGVSAANGSSLLSYGDNRLNGNNTDGTFTGTISRQ